MESLEETSEGHEHQKGDREWRFIHKRLGRPGASAIDFTKWNKAQTPIIQEVSMLGVSHIRRVSCTEVQEFLSEESTEMGIAFLIGRMFAQCFYQFGIDEIIEKSEYATWTKEDKLWMSNVILGEECGNEKINTAAAALQPWLEKYLIDHAETLMEKSSWEVRKNFLGK